MLKKKRTRPEIILASQSPRRKEMLRQLGIRFTICAPGIRENWGNRQRPETVALELAEKKARKCAKDHHLVIAMDTLVVVGRRILGKPRSRAEASKMLRLLSNRAHTVITGVALLLDDSLVSNVETTTVSFRNLLPEEIAWYVKSGEAFDKAGAYAIQGLARIFVTRINGCYYNVIGFPLDCFQRLLHRLGLTLFDLQS